MPPIMTRILIADDEAPIRAVVRRLLSLHGYLVDEAADGTEAIDQLQKEHYDLLIIDRAMPVMSGIDAVAILRTSPKFKGLKILMLTSASTTQAVDEAFDAGIEGYVVKPFDVKKLLEKIEAVLRKQP